MDNISTANSRETQVHLLLRYLPSRGPRAFSVFKDKLSKDYPWLSDRLTEELGKLQAGQEKINKKLLMVIATRLVPLVCSDNNTFADTFDDNINPAAIIQRFSDLLNNLEMKCRKALDIENDMSLPLHKLIEYRLTKDRVRHEMIQSTHTDEDGKLKEISKENRDLKKQLKEAQKMNKDTAKMKAEIENLKQTVKKQKDKLKEQAKMSQGLKKRSHEVEKLKKEIEIIKAENENLRVQMHNNMLVGDIYA